MRGIGEGEIKQNEGNCNRKKIAYKAVGEKEGE